MARHGVLLRLRITQSESPNACRRNPTSRNFSRGVLVDTQGILRPADWANELHPTPAGFIKIAQKFADTLKATV